MECKKKLKNDFSIILSVVRILNYSQSIESKFLQH